VVSNRVNRLEGFAVLTRQTAFSYCVQWRRDSHVSSAFLGRKAYRHFFRNFGTLATQSIKRSLHPIHRTSSQTNAHDARI